VAVAITAAVVRIGPRIDIDSRSGRYKNATPVSLPVLSSVTTAIPIAAALSVLLLPPLAATIAVPVPVLSLSRCSEHDAGAEQDHESERCSHNEFLNFIQSHSLVTSHSFNDGIPSC